MPSWHGGTHKTHDSSRPAPRVLTCVSWIMTISSSNLVFVVCWSRHSTIDISAVRPGTTGLPTLRARTTRQRKRKCLELQRIQCAAWRAPVRSTTTGHPRTARWATGLRTCRTGCLTNNDTVHCVTWRSSNVRGNFTATSGSRHFSPSAQPQSPGAGCERNLGSVSSSCSPRKYLWVRSSTVGEVSV
jgi:hypothetical protein